MTPVLIFGNRDTAALTKFYLSVDSIFTPVAFVVNGDYLKENNFENLPVVAFEDIEKVYPASRGFNAIIPILNNRDRNDKYLEFKKRKYNIISYISSKSTIWSPIKGENCIILENNTIQPFVYVGNNVIMWSGNHIGHHSRIEDNVFISSHVVVSGHCIVENFCWLGVNSTIRDRIILRYGSLIGMGSCVVKETEPNKTYIGNPARIHEIP